MLKKKQLKAKEKLMQKLINSIDPLLEENESLQADLVEQRERKIVRWAEEVLRKRVVEQAGV